MTYPVVPDDGTALASVRLANDQRGNLHVLVMGRGPFPMLAWLVPRQFVDELLVDGSAALVQCDAETSGVGLHFPPGTAGGPAGRYVDATIRGGQQPAAEEPREPAVAD